jgi:hypothetical protein
LNELLKGLGVHATGAGLFEVENASYIEFGDLRD